MARVRLVIDDPTQQMTLRAVLGTEGHTIVTDRPEVVFADSAEYAVAHAQDAPTIVLATASQIPDAVQAMREGVYGYLFVPFQAGEAQLMVERARASHAGRQPESTRVEELKSLAEVEEDQIQNVLRKCNHNQAKAARILGIGRNTLWRKLKKTQAQRSEDAT